MKRKIIHINEDKCDGCGACVPDCPEGAIRIVDGKARLTGESLCDGLGACLGACPRGAITIGERDVEEYDEVMVMRNISEKGDKAVEEHLKHLEEHGEHAYLRKAREFLADKQDRDKPCSGTHIGCPGSRTIDRRGERLVDAVVARKKQPSELRQWPVQLKLVNPHAPYFENADMVIAADCVPFAYPGFHERFLKDRTLLVFCPKLDDSNEEYMGKIREILETNDIRSVTVVHMEVPCCNATTSLVEEAIKMCGKNVLIKDYTISLEGEIT
ncbi:MAG: 4Fe-4S binding protein [Candidatus Omnitrophica bacterium]|nr:4Fe-4S binding protein [Candidatus Omnitrophota bacterium]MDD5488553.1 4Fe-4S binding protein [Candidatus Omnitrophota bacterium]